MKTARDLIRVVTQGDVKIAVNEIAKLDDVVRVHQDLESRATTGSTVLVV
jgi:NADPH2:quinone reductase